MDGNGAAYIAICMLILLIGIILLTLFLGVILAVSKFCCKIDLFGRNKLPNTGYSGNVMLYLHFPVKTYTKSLSYFH